MHIFIFYFLLKDLVVQCYEDPEGFSTVHFASGGYIGRAPSSPCSGLT